MHLLSSARPPRIWAIVGATGTGKSDLSLGLADALQRLGRPAEIVNADAMQLYRGMDIGTAKVPVAQRHGIPHHLFDILEPRDASTVAGYQPLARRAMSDLLHRGSDVIIIGGSGLYVSSAIFEFAFPPRDPDVRAALESDFAISGIEPLLAELRERDPVIADAVDRRNPRRVIRALEVLRLGGDARVVLPEAPEPWRPEELPETETRIIGVGCERSALVRRLDARVERMWAAGLLDEVHALIPRGIAEGPTASRAIGYAQALAQLEGSLTEAEAIAATQALTRKYARRQVSWFSRYPEITWIDGPDLSRLHGDL